MQWLNKVVDEALAAHPDGEIIVSSGVSPSGKYHLGTLREVLTAEAIARAINLRGRKARHLHIVDDLDPFRKLPAGLSDDFTKYLGQPLCTVPSPDGSAKTYADYYLTDLLSAADKMKLIMEVVRSHEKYEEGFFAEAIEKALASISSVRKILEDISGRKLDDTWSPIQVLEGDYLKNRQFLSIDKTSKSLKYLDHEGAEQSISYDKGQVKLNWRIDWPARWWLMAVQVEPFGRDHATKGGSYDTGAVIVKDIFGAPPPMPVPYNFIIRAGETKKMSKSAGDTVTLEELLQLMPTEIIWYFILRYPPEKQLVFDEGVGLVRLFDEFGSLLAKTDKSSEEQELIDFCLAGHEQTVSGVPFSHLVASYQAALKDPQKTLEIIARTEHAETVKSQTDIIKRELAFIDSWLDTKAPEEVKFNVAEKIDGHNNLSDSQTKYLNDLADRISQAPDNADGEWYHRAIYDLKDESGLSNQELFQSLYRVLVSKDYGPRAGWFLSTLASLRGRDWLVKRLRLDK
jgi:lysyl-tRNA synthetase class 1